MKKKKNVSIISKQTTQKQIRQNKKQLSSRDYFLNKNAINIHVKSENHNWKIRSTDTNFFLNIYNILP